MCALGGVGEESSVTHLHSTCIILRVYHEIDFLFLCPIIINDSLMIKF